MHEVGIAERSWKPCAPKPRPATGARPSRSGVRIGAMAGVDPDSLAFCFEALVKGSDLEPLELAIEPGAADELEFAYLELEEP